MGYLTLIKYAVIAVVIGSIAFAIHSNGRKIERAEWLEKEREEKARLQAGIDQIVKHVEEQNKAVVTNTIDALNEREKQIEKLNNDYDALFNTHQRLRFKTNRASCDQPLPGQTESASLPAGAVTVELPAAIESGIRAIGRDIEQELINCNALRDIIEPVVEVVN